MNKVPASANAISEAALKVSSREEITQMSPNQRRSFLNMIARRLDQPGPAPTQAELEGIKDMLQDLYHPALGRVSQ
ncbi:MAG: hypothetical protein KA207_02865 [Burkholderiaceae bacterium]|nr:hypothetical protein [Burkholderiaceae bacterium]